MTSYTGTGSLSHSEAIWLVEIPLDQLECHVRARRERIPDIGRIQVDVLRHPVTCRDLRDLSRQIIARFQCREVRVQGVQNPRKLSFLRVSVRSDRRDKAALHIAPLQATQTRPPLFRERV